MIIARPRRARELRTVRNTAETPRFKDLVKFFVVVIISDLFISRLSRAYTDEYKKCPKKSSKTLLT